MQWSKDGEQMFSTVDKYGDGMYMVESGMKFKRKQQPKVREGNGVVEFDNINALKKKSVRGMLRKRAKRYESDSDENRKGGDSADSDGETVRDPTQMKRKKVQKSSLAEAFQAIMSKKIDDDMEEKEQAQEQVKEEKEKEKSVTELPA